MTAAVELLLVAAAYRLLRENTGRTGRVFRAAAMVYEASYAGVVS